MAFSKGVKVVGYIHFSSIQWPYEHIFIFSKIEPKIGRMLSDDAKAYQDADTQVSLGGMDFTVR